MLDKRSPLFSLITFAAVFGILVTAAPLFAASRDKVLHRFHNQNGPVADLIFDAAGNLYGTTYEGGVYSYGTVFELMPGPHGKWTVKVLHNFGKDQDGQSPVASLIFDAAGNLYGTTAAGGRYDIGCDYGCGTVFQLTPSSNGKWTERVLHNFGKGVDGWSPLAGLTFDTAGNLYGTTYHGGPSNVGTVFQMKPNANGTWTESVLLSFNGKNGAYPAGSLIFDATGSLYGTTAGGGAYSYGTVFELTPTKNDTWTEKLLFIFKGRDGVGPNAALVFDGAGKLYGTTVAGGAHGYGTVFQLTPAKNGRWTEKVLHSFANNGHSGDEPYAAPILDTAGRVYGTTYFGGAHGDGTVFQLTPNSNDTWTETVLHNFTGGSDGGGPNAGLVFDAAGNLYGVARYGGNQSCNGGCGTVFEIMP